MFLVKNIKVKIFIALLIGLSYATVSAVYVPNTRETSMPPEEVVYVYEDPTNDGLEYLYSAGDLEFYFRESRDTVAIVDTRNDYTWKTGLDLEFSKDIDDDCDSIEDFYWDQFIDLPVETFTGFTSVINPLLTDTTVLGSEGRVAIKTEDIDNTYLATDVALTYTELLLEQGKTYRLSMTLDARNSRSMQVVVGTYIDEVIVVPTDETVVTFEFEMTDVTTSIPLNFYLGYIIDEEDINTTVYLDNVMLEEVLTGEVVAETNQIERGDFTLLNEEQTIADQELLDMCRQKELKLNTTYTGFANSLLTIEYYDISNNIKRISSASYEDVTSRLAIGTSDSHYKLIIDFQDQNIEIVLNIYFDDEGIRFEVKDEDVTGLGVGRLAAIVIAPFMGASGGQYETYQIDKENYEGDYDGEIVKYAIPGYTLIPDGSGTLIRYNDNTVKLNDYEAQIYGTNVAQEGHFYYVDGGYVPFKRATMPVFGMAHGNDQQAAFVAFATQGDEYMQIVSMPEENLTYYNFTYPRFEYNKQYLQVYNKAGWGYLTFYDERNHFDIDMRYNLLSGDGTDGHSADYVGMALSYKDYLIGEGILYETNDLYSEVPLRLDFLMSDAENGITGFQNQVTTTASGVDRILSDFMENGITNINSGLLGWQDGGITLGDPSKVDFTREIGRESDFEDLINEYNDLGVDISFAQDYYLINEEMMTLRNNATKHTSTWYPRTETFDVPVSLFYYARPVKSIEWLLDQTNDFNKIGVNSYTVSGITNNLTSDYTNGMMRTEAKEYIQDGFSQLDDDKLVNGYQPNAYLFEYIDRYLQTPIYGTQFLIETDTVPFVQLVLQNTMELYGPYSNFSFYTNSDVLRMVDYNIYPNFVLTEQPAYLLTDTLSRTYYSTEYNLYEELIVSVYESVNGALSGVVNANWVDRTVIENGIVVNEYDNGTIIVINYTDEEFVYDSITISPVSYQVIGG